LGGIVKNEHVLGEIPEMKEFPRKSTKVLGKDLPQKNGPKLER
jgi:hypothetical protein